MSDLGQKQARKLLQARVNPAHYKSNHPSQLETIHIITAFDLNFCLGNVVKYVCRAGKKSGVRGRRGAIEDLSKAKWYLEKHIEVLELEQEEALRQ